MPYLRVANSWARIATDRWILFKCRTLVANLLYKENSRLFFRVPILEVDQGLIA